MSRSSLEVLKEFSFHRLEGLSNAAFANIRSELILGVLGQKTPHEVARAIGKKIDGPGPFKSLRHRAEAITRTEMGRVFSAATQHRMDEASQAVPGLKKKWKHSGHPKVARPHHKALDGYVEDVDKPFLVGSVSMMYPRDPAAPVGEIINCGCDHIPWHPAWDKKKTK